MSSSNDIFFQKYWAPAHRLIMHNNINEFIKLTEEDNYEHINMRRNDGNTLLHIACNNASDEFILYLLKHGAKANLLNYKGESPMYNLIDRFINSETNYFQNREIVLVRVGRLSDYTERVQKSLKHFIQYTTKEDLRRIIEFPQKHLRQKTLYQRLEDFRNITNMTLQSKKEIDTWLRILHPFVLPNSSSDNNNNNNNGRGASNSNSSSGSGSSRKKRKTNTTTTNDVVIEKILTVDEILAKQLQEAVDKDEVVDLTQTNQQNQQTDITIQDRMTMVSTITTILVREQVSHKKTWTAVDYKTGWIQNQAIRIENLMFQNATSRDEYIDKKTIRNRWNKGVEVYNRNKQKSGASTVKKETNQVIQQIKDLKL